MNVAEFLLEGKEDGRRALLVPGRDYSYGELRDATHNLANALVNAGGQKGDRVVLAADNSFFWVAAYLGTLQAGLVCVPLPTSLAAEDLNYIVRITEPRFAFVPAGFSEKHGDRFYGVPVLAPGDRTNGRNRGNGAALNPVQHTVPESVCSARHLTAPHDLAALWFTSGSTGRPRGVMISHGNIIENTKSIVQFLGLTERDCIMAVLPFHYCFGASLLHTHLRVGGSLVLDSRFMYPEAILQRMQEAECTGFAGVPTHFQILLRKSSLRKRSFPKLRYVQQAGGHLAPAFISELREALPGTQIFIMYGQTEATSRLSYLPPEWLDRKLGSIGKGIPGVKLCVLNEAGHNVRPGEVGEIVAEGGNVTQGYWHAPEETAVCFRNGKLYTGDLGVVDEDGFIYVVGRAKDFLKCGGKRVSCRQLEEQLLQLDELLEAAIVGMPDDVLGEAVKAFVVPRQSGCDGLETRVELYCRKHMPAQHVPKEVVVLQALPKSSAGKVLKQQLREMATAGQAECFTH